MIGATCRTCDQIHGHGDVVALTRFAGISGYRTPDGQIFETRAEAQVEVCPGWKT
jgi:hypothetical protein